MKKLISFLTAAAMTVSCGAAASASGFAESMNTVEANNNGSINIIYNGQLIKYTDAVPENINDRVMLPFRAVLEQMGAKVDYEDQTRLVTASRGDITLKFTLEDDTIYVNNNGQSSEIKMDVPMVIKNDRTLVPIRFMSNALGMQIGWEGDYSTVLIIDKYAYAEDFAANAPNMMSLAGMNKYDYNTSTVDLSAGLSINEKNESGETEERNASLALKLDSKTAENTLSVSGKVSADIGGLGISVAPVKDADIEIIAADGKLYIKTDLVEKLLDSEYSSPITDVVKAVVTGDKWFYIDAEKLVDEMFGEEIPDGIKDLYKKLLSGDVASFENMQLPEVIASIGETEGDATLMSAMQADMMIDAYKTIDKHIIVTENKVEMKITMDELLEMLGSMGMSEIMTPEAVKELKDLLDFDIYAVSEYGENEASSKVSVEFAVKDETDNISFSLNVTETDKKEEGIAPAKAPENAVDLLELVESLTLNKKLI